MTVRCVWLSSALVVLLVLASLAPAAGQSLWTARGGSLVVDTRAARAGDIITVLVDEASSAEKNGETKLKRDSAFQARLDPPRFNYPTSLDDLLKNLRASGSGSSNYEGKGTTTRSDRATAQITAQVMRVLDNGNLLIEGRRLVVVHDETQTIVLSGVVRPQDIGADNTVRSALLADAEVRIEGRGAISDRQRPGIFHRLFDFLFF